jgi:hypothetical protein
LRKRLIPTLALAAAAVLATATAGSASVLINADGTGFVGKGDVQLALGGLNNAAIQSLTVNFTQESVTAQSYDWSCTKTVVTGNGSVKETVQERANVTTTSTTAVVSNVARVKNQITGYNLTGYGAVTTQSVTDGPAVGTCPDASSGFVFDDNLVTGDPVTVSSGLYVNGVRLA